MTTPYTNTTDFTSCPSRQVLPEVQNIPSLPKDISTVFLLSRGGIHDAVVSCCSPSPVYLAEGCYAWCEVPGEKTMASVQVCRACMSREGVYGISASNLVSGGCRAVTGKRGTGKMVLLAGVMGVMGVLVQLVSL